MYVATWTPPLQNSEIAAIDKRIIVVNMDLNSHRVHIALTALVSGIVVGSTILAFQKVNRLSKVKSLKDSIPQSSDPTAVS